MEDNQLKHDKLFTLFVEFINSSFNLFSRRISFCLAFAVHYDDDLSNELVSMLTLKRKNKVFHKNLLEREAWGNDNGHLLEYLDGKPNPEMNDIFEDELLKIDEIMTTYMNDKAKALHPTNIDIARGINLNG